MSIYLGDTPLAHNAVSHNIGEIIQSTIPLSDAGLHLLDGALINGTGSYSAFVTYIAGLVSSYPDLFTTETAWQQAVTDYGVCGKFVYDSTNNTVRLPKYSNKIYTGGGTAPVVGNGMTLGITNGTTNKGLYMVASNGELSGSSGYYGTQVGATAASGSGFDAKTYGVATDASKSGLIADLSNITTALDGYYYIVIANSTKTSIEVDIDEIATDLNGKADVDLSNVNVSGTSLASGWSMPSSRYIDLTLGASGSTYTAPANGWVVLNKVAGSDYYFCSLQVKDTSDNVIMYDFRGVYRTSPCTPKIPVLKGQQFTLTYNATGTTNYFRFVYAEGEPNV